MGVLTWLSADVAVLTWLSSIRQQRLGGTKLGRRKRRNYRDLVMPIAVLAALWAGTHPADAFAVLQWTVIIAVVVAVVVILVTLAKRNRNATGLSAMPRIQSGQGQAASFSGEQPQKASLEAANLKVPIEWSLQLIELLEWKRFEELCAAYFEVKGHTVKLSGLGADGGVDFYIYGQSGKSSKPLGIVQCKAWSSNRIGVKSIRELFGIMADVGCPMGIFIATTSFTPEAETFAAGKRIQLLDAKQMLRLIKSLPDEKQAELLVQATEGDYRTPSCPSCGTKLTL